MKVKRITFVLLILLVGSVQSASGAGENIGSLSHIHSVRALGNQIILGTHYGLFEYVNEKSVKRISPERFDVMGLAISAKGFYASGHPGAGSKLKDPVGLLFSSDGGQSWNSLGLTGIVDFHILETNGKEFYGADSSSGQLMYSSNSGKSWVKRGLNPFTDIAPNPTMRASVLGVKDGKIYRSLDAFKSSSVIKTTFNVDSIDWIEGSLIASSGKVLYESINAGSSWKKLITLPAPIGPITQSSSMIAVVMNGVIYSSGRSNLKFNKHQK